MHIQVSDSFSSVEKPFVAKYCLEGTSVVAAGRELEERERERESLASSRESLRERGWIERQFGWESPSGWKRVWQRGQRERKCLNQHFSHIQINRHSRKPNKHNKTSSFPPVVFRFLRLAHDITVALNSNEQFVPCWQTAKDRFVVVYLREEPQKKKKKKTSSVLPRIKAKVILAQWWRLKHWLRSNRCSDFGWI